MSQSDHFPSDSLIVIVIGRVVLKKGSKQMRSGRLFYVLGKQTNRMQTWRKNDGMTHCKKVVPLVLNNEDMSFSPNEGHIMHVMRNYGCVYSQGMSRMMFQRM